MGRGGWRFIPPPSASPMRPLRSLRFNFPFVGPMSTLQPKMMSFLPQHLLHLREEVLLQLRRLLRREHRPRRLDVEQIVRDLLQVAGREARHERAPLLPPLAEG